MVCAFCDKEISGERVIQMLDGDALLSYHQKCIEQEFHRFRESKFRLMDDENQQAIVNSALEKCPTMTQVSLLDEALCVTNDGLVRGIITSMSLRGIGIKVVKKSYFVKWQNVLDTNMRGFTVKNPDYINAALKSRNL